MVPGGAYRRSAGFALVVLAAFLVSPRGRRRGGTTLAARRLDLLDLEGDPGDELEDRDEGRELPADCLRRRAAAHAMNTAEDSERTLRGMCVCVFAAGGVDEGAGGGS